MRFKLKMLLCLFASLAVLFGTLPLSAARQPAAKRRPAKSATRPAPKRRSAQSPELQLDQLKLQVLLDRAGFSPGEIDGAGGANTSKALNAFRTSHQIASGAPDDPALLKALGADGFEPIVSYTITEQDTAGPFSEKIPQEMAEKSKLPALNYTSVLEDLGEKFHSSPALLKRLNQSAKFAAGEQIRVPNVLGTSKDAGNQPGNPNAGKPAPAAEQNDKPGSSGATNLKVVVSKNKSDLSVFNGEGKIILYAPVTSGSEHDPLPIGNWQVTQVRRNPVFYYNPDLFWDANPSDTKAKIPAGPNNPVGVVWIDINKPHYGIHGSPEPGRIGHSESHGCVRLTNWDAEKLAGLVTAGTPVIFEE